MPSSTAKKSATKIIGVPWSLKTIWNETLDRPQPRPLVPRNYAYASEIGKSFCDRYLSMYGVKPTNPPNTRSLRKFQAGDCWEFIFGIMLISAGMLKKKQLRVESKLPRLMRVSGRLDYIVGAPDDWKTAKENIKKMQEQLELMGFNVPPFFFTAIDKFVDKYIGSKLLDVIGEVKSVSSFMMEKIQKTGEPMLHQLLQNFHYVYFNEENIDNGKLFYIGKDDCQLEEFDIPRSEEILDMYKTDIRTMSKYYAKGFNPKKPLELMPPKEPLVLFEEGVWRFAKNWNIEYSQYLMLLYNYETPEAYRMGWQRKVNAWNAAFKRYVMEGQTVQYKYKDEMKDRVITVTPNNKEKREDAVAHGFAWDKLVAKAKAAGAFEKPEEELEEEA